MQLGQRESERRESRNNLQLGRNGREEINRTEKDNIGLSIKQKKVK